MNHAASSAASIASSPTRAHGDRTAPRRGRPGPRACRFARPPGCTAARATRKPAARRAPSNARAPLPPAPPRLRKKARRAPRRLPSRRAPLVCRRPARAPARSCATPPGHSARSTRSTAARRLGRAQRAQLGGGEVLHGGAREKLERLPRQRHDGSPHDALRAQVEHGLEQPEQTAARERVHRRDLRGVVFRRFSRGFVGVRRKRRGREVEKERRARGGGSAFLRRSIRRRAGTRGDILNFCRDRPEDAARRWEGRDSRACSFRTFRIGVCSDRARGRRLGEGNGRRSPPRSARAATETETSSARLRTLSAALRAPPATVSATLVADAERERL